MGAALESRLVENTEKDILEHTVNKKYADVLIIVTGGTLTTINTDHGYVAAPGLSDRLKLNSTIHD